VRAYEKDDVTGIVRHLDDQCIGCQYCILVCPYDVPKYNRARGIVRKCDMCSNRLAVGEAPACVQSCPNQAIRITTVRRQEIAENCESGAFLPGAPDPHHTQPTTHYRTSRVFPRNTLPADYYSVHPEHAHWPLVLMLVLTQLSVGAFLVELLLETLSGPQSLQGIRAVHACGAVFFGLVALAASTLHLGRPHLAFRAVIGLKSSWLSREIVAFGLFAVLAVFYAGVVWKFELSPVRAGQLQTALGSAVVAAGLAGIGCSIMIYHCTRRALWNGAATTVRFGLTTLLLGQSTALFTMLVAADFANGAAGGLVRNLTGLLFPGLVVTTAAKLLFEASLFAHRRSRQMSPLKRSALLMSGELARATRWRFALGFLGGILLPAVWMGRDDPAAPALSLLHFVIIGQFAALLAGELFERYLFFSAVVASRMPGGLRT
jgi:DMSO reductase anchor subunit/ferredoxin